LNEDSAKYECSKSLSKFSDEHRAKLSAASLANRPPNSQKIQVLDLETEIKTEYPSIRQAAKALNCFQSVISANLISKKQKPYLGRYQIRRIS
jgi:hypothetical protein